MKEKQRKKEVIGNGNFGEERFEKKCIFNINVLL